MDTQGTQHVKMRTEQHVKMGLLLHAEEHQRWQQATGSDGGGRGVSLTAPGRTNLPTP